MIEPHSLGNAQGSRNRFVMAAVILILTFSIGLSWFAVAPITPLIMAEFNINRGTASLLISLIALTGLIVGIPGGVVINRIGSKKAIFVGAVLASLPALSFLAEDYFLLLLTRIALGAGMALFFFCSGSVSDAMVRAQGASCFQWFMGRSHGIRHGGIFLPRCPIF